MGTRLTILRPGCLPYADGFDLQSRTASAVADGAEPTLILLQHPPTYTLGRRADHANIRTSEQRLRSLGADVVRTDRGGDVTFHGPGQIVGYPIMDLRRIGIGVSDYVCGLEQVLIDTLASFDIAGARSPLNRGVWVGGSKIAAIGVRVSRGITTHGFALNVSTDLSWFDHIIPCGLPDVRMTSMEHASRRSIGTTTVELALIDAFVAQFALTPAGIEVSG